MDIISFLKSAGALKSPSASRKSRRVAGETVSKVISPTQILTQSVLLQGVTDCGLWIRHSEYPKVLIGDVPDVSFYRKGEERRISTSASLLTKCIRNWYGSLYSINRSEC